MKQTVVYYISDDAKQKAAKEGEPVLDTVQKNLKQRDPSFSWTVIKDKTTLPKEDQDYIKRLTKEDKAKPSVQRTIMGRFKKQFNKALTDGKELVVVNATILNDEFARKFWDDAMDSHGTVNLIFDESSFFEIKKDENKEESNSERSLENEIPPADTLDGIDENNENKDDVVVNNYDDALDDSEENTTENNNLAENTGITKEIEKNEILKNTKKVFFINSQATDEFSSFCDIVISDPEASVRLTQKSPLVFLSKLNDEAIDYLMLYNKDYSDAEIIHHEYFANYAGTFIGIQIKSSLQDLLELVRKSSVPSQSSPPNSLHTTLQNQPNGLPNSQNTNAEIKPPKVIVENTSITIESLAKEFGMTKMGWNSDEGFNKKVIAAAKKNKGNKTAATLLQIEKLEKDLGYAT